MNESLYQQALLELAKRRVDSLPLEGAGILRASVHNPLCGDIIELSALLDSGEIKQLSHRTRGCVLCGAAMQNLADLIKEENKCAALSSHCAAAEAMFSGGVTIPSLEMFIPVIARPSRHECVLLPFRALKQILSQADKA